MPNDQESNAREGGLVVVQRQPGDETALMRGTGMNSILGQFTWAVFVTGGVLIPTEKLGIATDALLAAGWTVHDPLTAVRAAGRRMPLPLPECTECSAPYRRGHDVQLGECCTGCGAELVLAQHDPNVQDATPQDHCPSCRRAVMRDWKYCSCGEPLPPSRQPEPGPAPVPWRERIDGWSDDPWSIDVRAPSRNATLADVRSQKRFWERYDSAAMVSLTDPADRARIIAEFTGSAFELPPDVTE